MIKINGVNIAKRNEPNKRINIPYRFKKPIISNDLEDFPKGRGSLMAFSFSISVVFCYGTLNVPVCLR